MDDPDWSVVLQTLHESKLGRGFDADACDADSLVQYLTRETGLSEAAAQESLFFLDDVGLVEVSRYVSDPDDPAWDYQGLTREGFEVAQERVMRVQQHRSNRSVVALTLVLAAAAAAQAGATALSPGQPGAVRLVAGGLLLVGLVAFVLFFRRDIARYVRA